SRDAVQLKSGSCVTGHLGVLTLALQHKPASNLFILATHDDVRRKQCWSFHLGFEGFRRCLKNFPPQASVKFFRQAWIAAWMRDTHSFYDTVRAHLHRHWKHRTD